MSACDFGMYYFDIDKPEFPGMKIKARTAAGNKVPSYYEAGIPVLMARKLEYSARMVETDRAGILISPEDIPRMKSLLDACDYRALQGAVAEARQRWSGAGRGAMLVDFYRTLLRA